MEATIGAAGKTMAGTQAGVREYDTKTDSKKRITLRGSRFDYYHVMEFPNGKIELQPRELREPFEISKETLGMMDRSIENLKKGITSEPIDFSEFDFIEDLEEEGKEDSDKKDKEDGDGTAQDEKAGK